MNISFFDSNALHKDYQSELESSLLSTLNEGKYIKGPSVKILEEQLACLIDVKNCISCANGSEAITLAIKALKLDQGSEVIIPSFNYVSAAESAQLCGLTIKFCDVELDTFHPSLEQIKKQINEKTKLIILSHLFGSPISEIEEIALFCKEKKIYLIEDNAQSFGSQINNKYTGSFGIISTTSFFPTKNLACIGDGGAIFTNDDNLAHHINALASHGQTTKYKFDFCGYNSRLDTLQASVLLVKLKYLQADLEKRWQNASLYYKELESLTSIRLPKKDKNTFNQFTIRVLNNKRDLICQRLKELGIPTMIYYPIPLHKQEAFKANNSQILVNSELLTQSIFSLPIYPGLKSDEISYICSSIKGICE
jgi:UDP-2-acetamido-2-deoxy-ribo-hexuluronate aminotransferase